MLSGHQLEVDAPDRVICEILEKHYALQPARLLPLKPQQPHWRGIYQVQLDDRSALVLRMMRPDTVHPPFPAEAQVLAHLQAYGYPAPSVIPTLEDSPVGATDEWSMLLTTFIAGSECDRTAALLQQGGARLAQLHMLPAAAADALLPDSWWPPASIFAQVVHSLETWLERWPAALKPLAAEFLRATKRLAEHDGLSISLVHGDCWHRNAVITAAGDVVLIDWDSAGIGYPLLDLATLLLSSYYDLRQPLLVTADPALIAAIMAGYQATRPLPAEEAELLLDAIRFCLAEAAARYFAATAQVSGEEPFLKKLQARFAASAPIAAYARRTLTP